MKERDRYLKIVEWSEEDQCYIGPVANVVRRLRMQRILGSSTTPEILLFARA